MERNTNFNRIISLDALRVFSIFMMMLLHTTALNWTLLSVNSVEWQVLNIYDSIARFCVPVFLMISGVFFLDNDRNYTLEKLFSKNILRIVTAFIFWSTLYTILNIMSSETLSIKEIITEFINGHYHMWFLFTLVGLYLVVLF